MLLQGLGLKVLDLAVPKLLKDPLKSNKTGWCGTFLTCRWLPFIVPIVEVKNNCTSLDADSAIIKAIKEARDDYVLQQLYEELYPKIEQFIVQNSGSQAEAADIFQDAVVAFYKQVKKGKFNESYTVSGFVFSVSRNLWYNRVKRRNRQTTLSEETHDMPEAQNVMDDIITEERERNINQLLEYLEERCRHILIYAIFQKLSMKTISEIMGFRSEDVAKTKHYKCKQKLIKVLKQNPSLKNLILYHD